MVQLPDVLEDHDYSLPEVQRLGGFRTMLGVPMLHGGRAIGVIVVWRRQVDVFDDAHVHLVETFATQGAIAIATAELFGELAELTGRSSACCRASGGSRASGTSEEVPIPAGR